MDYVKLGLKLELKEKGKKRISLKQTENFIPSL